MKQIKNNFSAKFGVVIFMLYNLYIFYIIILVYIFIVI